MKRVLLLITALCFVGVAQADLVVNGVDPLATWNGYMNVFDTGGGYLWGSPWGTPDLPATFDGSGVLTLAPNTNTYNAADPYWVNPDGSGNKILEANFYQEWFGGLAGQTVTFNYVVGTNTLPAGYTAQAFVKVLDPDAGWATIQSTFLDLNSGAGSVSLTVASVTTPVTQVGFMISGLNVDPLSPDAMTGVTIVPEPATLALLGLGGLLLRRRK